MFDVAPSAFVPPPKVTSSVVRLIPRASPLPCDAARPSSASPRPPSASAARCCARACARSASIRAPLLAAAGIEPTASRRGNSGRRIRRARQCARRGARTATGCRAKPEAAHDQMHRQSLIAYGAPLCETVVDCSAAARAARCWCASRAAASAIPTCTCRTAISSSATTSSSTSAPAARCRSRSATRSPAWSRAPVRTPTIAPGAKVAVYPWIGCGECAACRHGDENICAAPRHLGITVDGGYATHVLDPASALPDRLCAAVAVLRGRADVLGTDRLCRAQAAQADRAGARRRSCWSVSAASA